MLHFLMFFYVFMFHPNLDTRRSSTQSDIKPDVALIQ